MSARPARPARPALFASAVLAAALTACSGSSGSTDAEPSSATAADSVTVTDPWVKAADADTGMTAVFGVLNNSGSTDVVVESATTSASDTTQLHEVVVQDGEEVMQEKEDGFSIPAGGTHELAPGGDHVMVMGMTESIEVGDEVTVELTFDDGSTEEFTALAKETTSGEENYDDSEMSDMDTSNGEESADDMDGME